MKNFSTIQEWVNSNPTKDEISKVLILVNKKVVAKTKNEIYALEKNLRKLSSIEKKMNEVKLPLSKDVSLKIKELSSQINELKRGLPITKKRVKKEVKA
jgi:archaellum component FlaC